MITSKTFETRLPFSLKASEPHSGLNNVFAAAVVSQSFRDALLNDPETALQRGYLGKAFALSPEEASLLISINAKSLTDLARQVARALER